MRERDGERKRRKQTERRCGRETVKVRERKQTERRCGRETVKKREGNRQRGGAGERR